MKEAAISFLELCASGNAAEAFERYAAEGFRHHNPYFRGDAESLRIAMNENAAQHPDKRFEVQRALEDGDLVAVHSRITFPATGLRVAVVHIVRFENGRIVEMWDVGQPVPEQTPNELGMF